MREELITKTDKKHLAIIFIQRQVLLSMSENWTSINTDSTKNLHIMDLRHHETIPEED